MPPKEKETVRKLIFDYGLKYLHSEQKFYKVYKISRADFLVQLERLDSAEEKEKYLRVLLYETGAGQGRRGVFDVGESVRLVHKKVEDKQKFFKFVDKYA